MSIVKYIVQTIRNVWQGTLEVGFILRKLNKNTPNMY